MDYLESEEWQDTHDEVEKLTKNLHLVIENCIKNLKEQDLVEIKDKMEMLVEQGAFWFKQDNIKRYVYDLKEFLLWVCDFVEEKDNEFFEN